MNLRNESSTQEEKAVSQTKRRILLVLFIDVVSLSSTLVDTTISYLLV